METTKKIKLAYILSLFTSLFLIFSGLLLLFFPELAGQLYGISDLTNFQSPMALGMGIRQLVIGLMIAILVFKKQPKALAYVILLGALVPLCDFFIFRPIIGTVSAFRHVVAIPLIIGLGIYLLNQLKETEEK